ncbi:hypothetical protein P154DRAFT_578543 [Amniculicola lignicola CBS 123094]|uniref:Uncharacterized protein n=1 Tax=Amniculicola lignicola CBS 123094 TaxID=1392246 RepID=A0A6A5WF64_9PLEO|nr:hypothetical protein P154DRAFT_578543 [Amniculicola lignicola CBS 123094]
MPPLAEHFQFGNLPFIDPHLHNRHGNLAQVQSPGDVVYTVILLMLFIHGPVLLLFFILLLLLPCSPLLNCMDRLRESRGSHRLHRWISMRQTQRDLDAIARYRRLEKVDVGMEDRMEAGMFEVRGGTIGGTVVGDAETYSLFSGRLGRVYGTMYGSTKECGSQKG